jgi:hypothetical protein
VEERPSKAANDAGNVLEAALEHWIYREKRGKESVLEVRAEVGGWSRGWIGGWIRAELLD